VRSRRAALAGLLAVALAAAPAARAGLAPRYGGALSIALPAAPGELDPARATTTSDLEAGRALHATLVDLAPDGSLRPGLLDALPEPEAGGRAWRLRLRPGLRFHDGRPLAAADVAASLSRLVAPATRSRHGWIAAPISGADEVREGRAALLPGVQVVSDLEIRVLLDAPFPELPRALAALPASVVPRGGPSTTGAGPFQLASRGKDGVVRLVAFDGFWRGRAYPDAVALLPGDARRAGRPSAREDVDLAIRPEPSGGAASRALPARTATYAVVNLRRLGRGGAEVRRALAALDRAELAGLSGRGGAVPLLALLPPSLAGAPPAGGTPGGAPEPAPSGPSAPHLRGAAPLAILHATGPDGSRAVADRLQVKLFDRGVRAAVSAVSPDALAARLSAGSFDLALVTLTFAATGPQGALLEVAWALGGAGAARRALARLAADDPSAALPEVADDLGAVPLYVSGPTASAGPQLEGLSVLPDGTVDPGDLWLAPPGSR
jgi:peptide/nickel transport system substrate-binding protein